MGTFAFQQMALRSNLIPARAGNASVILVLLPKYGWSFRKIRFDGRGLVESPLNGAHRNGQVVHSVRYAAAPSELLMTIPL